MGCGSSAQKYKQPPEEPTLAAALKELPKNDTTGWEPSAYPIYFQTGSPVTTTVIFLHGFGGSGADVEPLIKPIFEGTPGVRLIFLSSPKTSAEGVKLVFKYFVAGMVPGTILDDIAYRAALLAIGGKVASWLDDEAGDLISTVISTGGLEGEFNSDVLSNSSDFKHLTAYVHSIIRKEIKRGVSPQKIFIAGHSQGGMVGSLLSYTFPDAPLGGVVLCSSCPWAKAIQKMIEPVQKNLPILGFNSREDQVIPFSLPEERFAMLKAFGCDAEHKVVTDCTDKKNYHDEITKQMQESFVKFVMREAPGGEESPPGKGQESEAVTVKASEVTADEQALAKKEPESEAVAVKASENEGAPQGKEQESEAVAVQASEASVVEEKPADNEGNGEAAAE